MQLSFTNTLIIFQTVIPVQFAELFNLYYKPIFGYILHRTGNIDDTADIAAETFFKAFRHIQNFSYKGISVKVWLYRIATNEVNLYFRYKSKNIIQYLIG